MSYLSVWTSRTRTLFLPSFELRVGREYLGKHKNGTWPSFNRCKPLVCGSGRWIIRTDEGDSESEHPTPKRPWTPPSTSWTRIVGWEVPKGKGKGCRVSFSYPLFPGPLIWGFCDPTDEHRAHLVRVALRNPGLEFLNNSTHEVKSVPFRYGKYPRFKFYISLVKQQIPDPQRLLWLKKICEIYLNKC